MNSGNSAGNGILSSMPSIALMYMVVYVIAIGFAWWALQEFRFDLFLKRPRSAAAKTLQIFLSIVLGSLVANFFLQYLGYSVGLNGIF